MAEQATIAKVPVCELVKRQLGRRLGEDWVAGQRLPKLDVLARMIGAGQRNTHRALRELVDEGFLVARPGVGTFVAHDLRADHVQVRYGNQSRARALRAGGRLHGKSVAVLVHNVLAGSPMAELSDHAQHALREQGAAVQVVTYDPEKPDTIAADEADGLLVLLTSLKRQFAIKSSKVCCFVRNGELPAIAMPGRFDLVYPSGENGGFLAGEHLRQSGFERVAFLGRRHRPGQQQYNALSAARLAGFELGYGAALPAESLLFSDRYDDRSAAMAVPQYLAMSNRPSAIFAASDDLALGFIVGASSHGLEPGRDYHIIGFDGQARGREIFGGPLTTIDVMRPQIAAQAVRLLSDRLHDPDQPVRQIAHGCRLVRGGTVRPSQVCEGNQP